MKLLEKQHRADNLSARPIEAAESPAVRVGDAAAESTPAMAASFDSTVCEVAGLFKLLSDETRLRILYYLIQSDEHHVRALCELLDQSQPAVSHHLALMRTAGLISCRRQGKHNFYRLMPQRFAELLDLAFQAVPQQERRVRFEEYVLSHSPVHT